MRKPLNSRQRVIYEGFLSKLQGGMDRTQFEGVQQALQGRDLEPMLAILDSVNHLPPEANAERTRSIQRLYYGYGLREILKPIVPDDEARKVLLNKIAGAEVVHSRQRRENE